MLRPSAPPLDPVAWMELGCSAAVGYAYLRASLLAPSRHPTQYYGVILRRRSPLVKVSTGRTAAAISRPAFACAVAPTHLIRTHCI